MREPRTLGWRWSAGARRRESGRAAAVRAGGHDGGSERPDAGNGGGPAAPGPRQAGRTRSQDHTPQGTRRPDPHRPVKTWPLLNRNRAGACQLSPYRQRPRPDPAHATVEPEVRAAEMALQATETALDDAGRRREATRDALERATALRGEYFDHLRTVEESARQASQRREVLEARREEMEQRRARLSGRLRELGEALEDRGRRRGQLELTARATAFEQAERALGAAESILLATRGRRAMPTPSWQRRSKPSRTHAASYGSSRRRSKALAELAGPEPDGSPSSIWSISWTAPLMRSPPRSAMICSAAWTLLRRPTGARRRPRPPRLTISRRAAGPGRARQGAGGLEPSARPGGSGGCRRGGSAARAAAPRSAAGQPRWRVVALGRLRAPTRRPHRRSTSSTTRPAARAAASGCGGPGSPNGRRARAGDGATCRASGSRNAACCRERV